LDGLKPGKFEVHSGLRLAPIWERGYMLKIIFVLLALLNVSLAFGGSHSRIDTLGISKAGHIVALEEYGYKADADAYYVSIKFLNVWTKEYVGSSINLELPAYKGIRLIEARKKARDMAQADLIKYKISG
jgi:predicted secreted protein